jgi:trehalose 6-phosphate synthase
LPVALKKTTKGWDVTPGAGGLVTALAPVLQARGGTWIGWPGTHETRGVGAAMHQSSGRLGYQLLPVTLSEAEVQDYYYGFSNEILWPLFHSFEARCNFEPRYWQAYESANRKFAEVVSRALRPDDYVWIHDYQLLLVADMLRQTGLHQKLGFFLHIPFPAPGTFFKLPWRMKLLRGLLSFDLVGFQTIRDRRNFVHCLQQLNLPGLKVGGRGDVVSVEYGNRSIRVGAFPISIDYRSINREASTPAMEQAVAKLRKETEDIKLIAGIDRLDYTKGIPHRLKAFAYALERDPSLVEQACFIQVTVPSRENVAEYERLRLQIEQLVGQINGRFSIPGRRIPIHYVNRGMSHDEVLVLLRAADIGLVSPLKDGMNLVAKEYCACQIDESGVLILSEFAGAAVELQHGALLINPYDVEATADAICQALVMPLPDRKARMRRMRQQIARNDIFRWLDDFLRAAFSKQLDDFPRLEDHLPIVDLSAFVDGSEATA